MCLHRTVGSGHLFSSPSLLEELGSPSVDVTRILAKSAKLREVLSDFRFEELAQVLEQVATHKGAGRPDMAHGRIDMGLELAAFERNLDPVVCEQNWNPVGYEQIWGLRAFERNWVPVACERNWDEMGYRVSRDGWKDEASTEVF